MFPSDPQIIFRLAPVEDSIKFSSASSGQSFGQEDDESEDLPDPTCFFNFFFFITKNNRKKYQNIKLVQFLSLGSKIKFDKHMKLIKSI